MEILKEQKPDEKIVRTVDVKLNEEQMNIFAGGNLNSIQDFVDTVKNVFRQRRLIPDLQMYVISLLEYSH
jgi:hypothetical protein